MSPTPRGLARGNSAEISLQEFECSLPRKVGALLMEIGAADTGEGVVRFIDVDFAGFAGGFQRLAETLGHFHGDTLV